MFRPSRRDTLRFLSGMLATSSLSGWFPALAQQAAGQSGRTRSCILLWMAGGPSQLDTFDPKPDHENGGEFRPISTSVPEIQISEHFPQLATQAQHLAIVRSMQTKEGDHGRATYHLRTGYLPQGPIQYPTLGSLLSKELATESSDLPNYISVIPSTVANPAAFSPGFLGPRHAPLLVGAEPGGRADDSQNPYGQPLEVRNIRLTEGIELAQAQARLELLKFVDAEFSGQRPGLPTESHRTAYEQAVRMMRSPALQAFNLEEEPAAVREAYGRNRFGQACLLARRLVERGVPFIEVGLSGVGGQTGLGWDTHQENFFTVKGLCETLDPAWSTLLRELQDRGLLDSTLIVWMGEFGRTPVINSTGGRDHFPTAWSTVLCGGGIQGGQVYGRTSDSGMEVVENPVKVSDLFTTISRALQVDPRHENLSNVGRPIRLADSDGVPLDRLLTH